MAVLIEQELGVAEDHQPFGTKTKLECHSKFLKSATASRRERGRAQLLLQSTFIDTGHVFITSILLERQPNLP